MWIFTRYGFFSIACARADQGRSRKLDPALLMIRARQRSHLDQLRSRFPELAGLKIEMDSGTDYRYRMFVPKAIWKDILMELVEEQVWSNFKSETERFLGDGFADYERALHRVWGVMRDLQVDEGIA